MRNLNKKLHPIVASKTGLINIEYNQSLTDDNNSLKKPTLKKKVKIFTSLLISLSLITALILYFSSLKNEYLTPIPGVGENVLSQTTFAQNPKKVIGFLPYWNFNQEENLRYNLLTHIAFFSLSLDENGNIKKLQDDKTEEPGWSAYKSGRFGTIFRKAKDNGTKVLLTIQAMDHETIESIVNNPQAKKNAIRESLEIISQKNLDGINVDFEYAGTPVYQITKNFTSFIKELNHALHENNPNLELSIDVYADASSRVRIWDIPQLISEIDYVVIMAYDFHRINSSLAAPVAPIRGAPENWQYDITKTLNDFSKVAPLEKIILGVPYYGYEWRTTSAKLYAATYPASGSLLTYKRAQSLISDLNPKMYWDELALAPRLAYSELGKNFQAYYENETSLGLKYDLINESGLAGTAIWALGYDGNYPYLWNLLAEKFPK